MDYLNDIYRYAIKKDVVSSAGNLGNYLHFLGYKKLNKKRYIPGSIFLDYNFGHHDAVHGSLIEQVDRTVDLVYTKYMKALISYEGIVSEL